ncbi:MAG: hypothetical protein WAL75_05495 [Terracidiphilus sp.]
MKVFALSATGETGRLIVRFRRGPGLLTQNRIDPEKRRSAMEKGSAWTVANLKVLAGLKA